MDPNIQKALTDKLYDKRKSGALDLEALVRQCLAEENGHDRIAKIVNQLCHDYAYQVHQPHARNGGLIGLAAASIALGPEVARYLEEIVPPVLACFTDQDARVRYYACESMYNIAKVAKGEILLYFNEVFDALCKLAADSELSVKNGAELLDRLVKDIVSESAASYVSVLRNQNAGNDIGSLKDMAVSEDPPTAFSLIRFIPLLKERITVMNPFTRMFLVSWVTLLDSIPDLELVTFIPEFLGGIFKYLSDPNQDVHTATQVCLDKFLAEIKKIARLKRGIAESKRSQAGDGIKRSSSTAEGQEESGDTDDHSESSTAGDDTTSADGEEDWIPGQDVQVDHSKILGILVTFLGGSSEEEIKLTSLRWIDHFFEIAPEDILSFIPRLLSQVLPAMSYDVEQVRQAANRVNSSLVNYILSLPDEKAENETSQGSGHLTTKEPDRRESNLSTKIPRPGDPKPQNDSAPTPSPDSRAPSPCQVWNVDYEATLNALTLQFLNEHEATRVAALDWLIMLHRKSPPSRKLEMSDGTFPALLKTLSDSSDHVVRQDLILLCQMFRNTDDSKFASFMVNLIKLFGTDRRLLETRGNLIIRQLCLSLSAERIYRTLADCLERDEDVEFASIMVQNLNNNLITAPELADLRKRLRNLETRDGQTFFVTLFRSWCHNAVATFSLCLLAQAYEQAYHLLQIFAELEMTVNMLIQIDKLVQLLESPVFTYLRLQLLEPERYPHLYKCLYGLLMLLPQSSAFAALKNRLNSVSAIGYLHIANFSASHANQTQRTTPGNTSTSSVTSSFERPNRLKSRDDAQNSGIKWVELLDKFRTVQERARRATRNNSIFGSNQYENDEEGDGAPEVPLKDKSGGGGVGGGVGAVGAGLAPRAGTPTSLLQGRGVGVGAGGVGGKERGGSRVGMSLGRFTGVGKGDGKGKLKR
ncbi:ARM repeat-containing protein [Tothia fuscella]|uniref:ARM repeat-containing protein n=1 Tax=Tothia fuscella TaxID=1048955 RepID=A0A9P4P2X6_9PEZI|nr:ARM repeat-containing protein [Tothia fuscella]